MLRTQLPILRSVVGQEQEEGIRNEPFLELINAGNGFNLDFSSIKYGSLQKLEPQVLGSVSPDSSPFNCCHF